MDPDRAEMLAFRLEVWKHLAQVLGVPCVVCGDRGSHAEIRDTPAGDLCIACWLLYVPCAKCGTAAGAYEFAKKFYCAECLNPDPDDGELAKMMLEAMRRHNDDGSVPYRWIRPDAWR